MLAIAKPTLTDGVGPGPPRFNQARPVECKPDKAAGVPKAGKLRIRFNGQVVVNKTITEADTGARKGQKRKIETADPAAQKVVAKKALSSGIESFVKPVMLVAGAFEAILGAPHAKLAAPRRASPTARHTAEAAAGPARMTAAASQSSQLLKERCTEQLGASPAGPLAKKQRLEKPAALQQPAAPAATSKPSPTAEVDRSQTVPAQKKPAPILAMEMASDPAQAVPHHLQQHPTQQIHSSAAATQQQQAQPSNAVPTGSSTGEWPTPAQPARHAQLAAPKVSQATPAAYPLSGRDLPVVERARAELRAAVAEREREKAAQQEAARAQASSQASPQQQAQPQTASSGAQIQKSLPAQGTASAQTIQVPNEEKARWLAKIRARRPTQEQKDAEEKQRIAEEAKREEERKQQKAEERARKEAIERIEKLQETLRKYRDTGVPEWLQKSALFEEEERDEWVGVYNLAGLPWPAKYDIPGACCMPDGADAADAQPGQAGPPGARSHEIPSRLARSDSDMDIDDPVLPDLPKMSLQAALESTAAVAQAAASGQSCGTHNGASPDMVTTSMAPPADLYPSAAAGPQAEARLNAAAAVLQANHTAKGCRPSPGSSESETEGVNVPAPKLEEGELAGNRRSAPQKDQQPRKDVTRDLTASYERRSRERYSYLRYSSERISREHSPNRLRHDWLERSRSRSRDTRRARGARPSSPDRHIHDRESSERYTYQRDSRERPSHELDSREGHYNERDPGERRYSERDSRERYSERDSGERRYSKRCSRERSPSRACCDRRERSRSRCREDERARRAPASSSVHEDPAELRAKMEALKSSAQHDERYLEVALAALQRRLVKALMAEHLQKKQGREADRARSRPAAASTEAPERGLPKQSAVVSTEKPIAAHAAAPPLPEGLPPPKLAPLPPVPVMPAAHACPHVHWTAQAAAQAPSALPACYPTPQHSAAVGIYPPQYGQQWPQQGWSAPPGVQCAPGVPQYWAYNSPVWSMEHTA